MIYAAMEVKQRRKSATADVVRNPFAYRAPKNSNSSKMRIGDADFSSSSSCVVNPGLQLSDSSLNYDPHGDHHERSDVDKSNNNNCCSSNRRSKTVSYAVKVFSLLLVGFAAGLLYHLATSAAGSTPLGRRLAVEDDVDGSFLTDELVKKLAQDNQMQEQEILKLKQQVQQRQQQEDKQKEEEQQRQQQQHQLGQHLRILAEQKQKAEEAFLEAAQHMDVGIKIAHNDRPRNLRGATLTAAEAQQQQQQHEQEHEKTFLQLNPNTVAEDKVDTEQQQLEEDHSDTQQHFHDSEQDPQSRIEEHQQPQQPHEVEHGKTFLDLSTTAFGDIQQQEREPIEERSEPVDDDEEEEAQQQINQPQEESFDTEDSTQQQEEEEEEEDNWDIEHVHHSEQHPQPQREEQPKHPHEVEHGKTFLQLSS